MGSNHSFFGFVKNTPRDSSEGWAYINKHMWSSSSLRKNKEVLASNGGGKFGKGIYFVFMLIGSKCRSWTWHPLIHHLKPVWEIHLSLIRFNYKVFPCVVFESMLPNHWSCHPYVQELSIWNLYWVGHLQLYLHSVSAFPVSIVQLPHTLFHFQTLLLISCHWWGIHQGPPVTSLVPSTSAHYPGLRLRNLLVPWSLHASMASFSLSTVDLHHWSLIERFRQLFDISSFIHSWQIVL